MTQLNFSSRSGKCLKDFQMMSCVDAKYMSEVSFEFALFEFSECSAVFYNKNDDNNLLNTLSNDSGLGYRLRAR